MVRAIRSPPESGRCGQGPPLAPGAPDDTSGAMAGALPHLGPPHTSDGGCCQDLVPDRNEGSENGSGCLQSPPSSWRLGRDRNRSGLSLPHKFLLAGLLSKWPP